MLGDGMLGGEHPKVNRRNRPSRRHGDRALAAETAHRGWEYRRDCDVASLPFSARNLVRW